MNNEHIIIESFQRRFLDLDGADVWFEFEDERIPAHKFILSMRCDWFNEMFFGSVREGPDVDMTRRNQTSGEFKEFLKHIYYIEPDLTLQNIEGVIDLAKESLSEELVDKCQDFLMNTITTNKDHLFFAYRLASLFEAEKLKTVCEVEIGIDAEKSLQSKSFVDLPYEHLQTILTCDALACEEKIVFHAVLSWARAACQRCNLDPRDVRNLRAQLKESVFQIRFTSMSAKEYAECIQICPKLFSVEELVEIACMIGRLNAFQEKKFNWTPRNLNPKSFKRNTLDLRCSRFKWFNIPTYHQFEMIETTTFTTNRFIILNGFSCVSAVKARMLVDVGIEEKQDDELIKKYDEQGLTLDFSAPRGLSYVASLNLKRSVLLKPKRKYQISITFRNSLQGFFNHHSLKSEVQVDYYTQFKFHETKGIVSGFFLNRIKDDDYIRDENYDKIIWEFLSVIGGGLENIYVMFSKIFRAIPVFVQNVKTCHAYINAHSDTIRGIIVGIFCFLWFGFIFLSAINRDVHRY